MLIKRLLIVLFGIIWLSCGEEESDYNVPIDFEPYVQRFIQDAAERGVTIDFSDTGLSIQFRDAVDKETGGVCRGNHRIEIEKFFWQGLTDFDKEGLIYHELGHCELNRGHRNVKLPNGEWASRMRGSPIPEGDNPVINYSGTRKEYYVDELFDETAPFPDWGSWTFDFNDFSQEDKNVVFSKDTSSGFDERLLGLAQGNFEIDLEMSTGTSEGFIGIRFMGNTNDTQIRIGFTREGEFAIDSGKEVWAFMFFRENYQDLQPGYNRLTVRRVGDFYHVFLNEKFIYWFDYKNPRGEVVASLNNGVLGKPEYRNIQISTLP